ncbi:protein ELYS isoform X4 [Myotis daubentonii]|uniref:protein ELYS isoform X4 n=1 Tax=Myotis daubentonii TaxID=98922 RepID=UPI002873BDF9|nr:protein ELYS isoform X4 [Myotis daubentonii]
MQDLTAQVTSGLLQFPEVTIEALGEDEITLESVLRGKFAAGKNGLAYLTCGPQLEVVHSITGERLSAYRFSGLSDESPIILAVKEFSWQKRSGLLIGLEDAEGSVLCLYDLGISRVVKAVVLPGRVIAIEPIINHGGASASTQHLHPSLRWLFGVAAVATNVGQILLIDLCLDDLSCSQNEVEASDLEVISGIPAEVPHLRERAIGEGRHLCFQLVSPSGTAVSTLSYINRTNHLAVGFSDGYLALWNMKSMKREYCTQLESGRVPVHAVTFQEPENDPRNCCYLWAVQSTQDSEGDVLSLHLLQLAFGDRKCLPSGQILYEGLEYCEERYTLDLTCGMFPLRGQTSNTKLLGCQSIEKFRSHGDREEGMSEALSPDTSVSIFTWQVNIYGQGKPSIYLGIFDINRWYHAQMPDSLRSGESLHNCSYFALWSLDSVVNMTSPHYILDILVHERSLSRGLAPSYSPPEQFFNPSSYNFDATCLLNSGVVHITCTGFQKETLTFLKKSGPFINEVISDSYNRCLMAGLLSPRLIDMQPSSLSQEEQLKAVLSAAIHTSSLGLLTGYIRRWILDEQPNSAANLRFVLEWTWNKVVLTKEEFDRLYDAVQLSRLCYNYPVIQSYYTSRRQKCELLSSGKWNSDYLMIDGMVSQLGDRVEKLWKRDEGGTGKYPPPSLHALLDIYLLDNVSETSKHFITIYLLLDIMYSFPNKTDTSIESFPTAFAISWDQVKLIQGFWLIDHNDYENGLDLLFHPATAKPFSWQHSKIIQAFMSQGEHRQALRYIQTMKPTVSSDSDIILHITVLLFNRCMIEAWSLLRYHSSRSNIEELLEHTYKGCQEMGLMEDLLKLPFTDTEQECLVRFLQSSTSVQNHELLLVHHLQRANYIPALKLNQNLKINLTNDRDPHLRERSVARNSILDQYGKVLPRVHRKLAMERAKPYRVPTLSVIRKVSQPKPLSAVPKRAVIGTVLTRSTFIHNVLSKVGEVWKSDEPKNSTLAYNSPRIEGPSPVVCSLPDSELPGAFVGTPILKASQKVSRLLDLVVHPVPQLSQCLGFIQQTPTRYPLYLTPSSSSVSSPIKGSHQNTSRASELHLLETPVVVKKAKTLAMSITSSGFAEFTPQSILRSGLRSTPLGSPSQSPGRSLTPPLRLKETRISFMEDGMTTKWTSGAADDSKTKAFVTRPFYKCGIPGDTEWLANKDKTSFSLNGPEMGPQEMDVRSENTPSQSLEKLDVSKVNSNVSTESLEYQDAPSPGEFEHVMAVKPASASTGLMTKPAETTEKDNDKDVCESVTPLDLEKPTGPLEDGETKAVLVAEEAVSVLNHSSPIQGADASLCVPLTHERKTLTPKSKVPISDEVSVETCTSTIRAAMADVVGDSGSSGLVTSESPVISEHRLDQEIAVNLEEDHEIEVDALKESVDLPEEKPPISDDSPDTQKVHVIENEKLEVQDSGQEAKNLSFNEYPSGTLKLQYNFETIEQQFCDLPDNKDAAECGDIAEVDGELFVAQSNFTLILEGEEEAETGDSAASNVLAKAANTVTDSKHVHTGENDGHGHGANLPSVIPNEQESQKTEALPNVPEPIKAAVAENVPDVIKDTRSKDITSDTMEQSIHENIPLISQKVRSSTKSVKSTLKTAQEASTVTMNVSQVSDMTPSRPRTRRQRTQSLDVKSVQQGESDAAPETPGLSVRKKTRKTKETLEASESASPSVREASQTQPVPQHALTPKRGRRKKDTSESLNSAEQELQVTPGRVLRSSRSQLLEPATTETSLRKEVKLLSVTKKTPKRVKKSVETQESVDIVNDLKTSKEASPRISNKRLRPANLETSENTGHEQDGKFGEQQRPVQGSKRVTKRDIKASGVREDSKLDSSPLTLQTEGDIPATPRKRGRPRKINPSLDVGPEAVKEENSPKKSKVQKRSARNTPAKSENTEVGRPTLDKSVLVPNEELVTVMSSKKKITKRIENQSQKRSLRSIPEKNIDEDMAQKEPKDQEEKLLAKTPVTPFSRSTRTRSSKAILLPDFSAPENESLFTPVSKVSRKDKAIKVEAPEQLKELISDLSSPFVLSPPALRTRRKNVSQTPQLVQELEDDAVGQQRVKRMRTGKTKQASKTTEKDSWSPPPVEIKLISPLATPAERVRSKPRRTIEETGKAPGRNRKRPSSFPKQIVRRKML